MINVKKTITSTIYDLFMKLTKLAQNNTVGFKKTLYLIIMDDVYDWAGYLDEPLFIQKKLKDLRVDFIINNPEFIGLKYDEVTKDGVVISALLPYVNVNTPQTNDTWKRVWDDLNVTLITDHIDPHLTTDSGKYTADPTCKQKMVYFPTLDGNVLAYKSGDPIPTGYVIGYPKVIDWGKLTTCDRMDIYINRETGVMYYLTEQGQWKPMTSTAESVEWTKITGKPTIYQGIKHELNTDDKTVDVELLTTDSPSSDDIDITDTDEDLEDVL